jgi:SAM-dependent methyltransferase
MPINLLHSLFCRVERGWDPIPADYAEQYAKLAWKERSPALVDQLEQRVGGLRDRRVLDLGGGPGQYSVLFAQRGAQVTWHDVSRTYQKIAMRYAHEAGVKLTLSLGYLEAANVLAANPFDLVFCHICWYYGRSDRGLARLVYSLVKPGGIGCVVCNTAAFAKPQGLRRIQYWLNARLWWKIGHPMPPRGRIGELIGLHPVQDMHLDYSSKQRDIVVFVKDDRSGEPHFASQMVGGQRLS